MAVELIMGLNAFKTMFDMAKGLQSIHDTAARDRAVMPLSRLTTSGLSHSKKRTKRTSRIWSSSTRRYDKQAP